MIGTAALLLALQLGPPSSPAPSFSPIADVVEQGIRRGIYPGAVVVVGRRDTVLYAGGFGHLTWARSAAAPKPESTLWDLASLTKIVATTSAVLVLVDQGRVALDAPVHRYLPRFTGSGREQITVRMLLDHTSGLRAYLPLYSLAKSKLEALDLLYDERPIRPPGRAAEYSDLNAILLGLLVEAVSREPLDVFARQAVFAPLGMTATVFAPGLGRGQTVAPSRWVGCCAAPGRVDDNNAYFLGGVAGHAGLFSTGEDLARFAQVWLRRGAAATGAWVSSGVVQRFLSRSPSSGSRALGWDTPEHDAGHHSVYGDLACASTYGHTGWTGTMFWIDPDHDLFLVFLTNRSLRPRLAHSISALADIRTRLSDLVIQIARR